MEQAEKLEIVEVPEPKKFHERIGIRIIALVLVVALVLSLTTNAGAAVHNAVIRTVQTVSQKLAPKGLQEHYALAGELIEQEDYTGALASINKCIRLDDGSDPVLSQDLLMKKGCLLYLLERDSEALTALNQVLETNPAYTDAYLVKAQIYTRTGETELLIKTLEQYVDYVPNDAEVRALLAQTLFAAEDYEGALKHYGLILKYAQPGEDMTEIFYLYGLTCIQSGDFAEAEESLVKALEKDDTLDGIYYYIGVCQMSREAYDEAVVSLTAAVERNSMVQLSRYSRGVCGLMVADYDLSVATEDLRLAASYEGSDADATVSMQARKLLEEIGWQGDTEPSQDK